jgi:hypothetical protein
MKKQSIGFYYKRSVNPFSIGFYVVTLVSTGEQLPVMGEDFDAFIVENGYASATASMGGCDVPEEILAELGFTLPQEELTAVC